MAGDENHRLKHLLKENNAILERKVQEIEQVMLRRDREKDELEGRIREAVERARQADARAQEEERLRKAVEETKAPLDSLKRKRMHMPT